MMRWFTRTVNGFVYAFGSSMVTSISQRAEVRTAEALGHLQRVGVRAAVDVEPAGPLVAEEVRRLDDQRVALPPAARVAEPPRLRVVVRRRPAVHVDVAQPVVRLVGDQRSGSWSGRSAAAAGGCGTASGRSAGTTRPGCPCCCRPSASSSAPRPTAASAADSRGRRPRRTARSGMHSGRAEGVGAAPRPRPPPPPPKPSSQMPEKSALPSGVRGAGAVRIGLPSAFRGTSGVVITATAPKQT